MRSVELLRHTDNDGDKLSPEGIAAAGAIGRERLTPPYVVFGSTGAARATEMVEIRVSFSSARSRAGLSCPQKWRARCGGVQGHSSA